MFAYCMNNPVNMSDALGNWPKWVDGAVNVVSGIMQATLGAAIGAAAGWTGVGAVAAAALVANGAATATQGIGQIVNSVTQTNTMREDNIIRTGVQSVGAAIGGDTGAAIAGAVYDTAIMAAALYTPSISAPQSSASQPLHTTSMTSPRKVSNPNGSHVQLDNWGNLYSYTQYDALGRQNLRFDFQGKPHAGVLPHVHIFIYPEQGGKAEHVFDLMWNLIG